MHVLSGGQQGFEKIQGNEIAPGTVLIEAVITETAVAGVGEEAKESGLEALHFEAQAEDAGVEVGLGLPEGRKIAEAEPVALMSEGAIARILDPFEPPSQGIGAEVFFGMEEEGTQDMGRAEKRNGREAQRIGAPAEALEEGFAEIVPVMGGDEKAGADRGARFFQEFVTLLTGPGFDRLAARTGGGVEPRGMEAESALRHRRPQGFRLGRGFGPQAMVDMGDMQAAAQAGQEEGGEEVEEDPAVEAARNGEEPGATPIGRKGEIFRRGTGSGGPGRFGAGPGGARKGRPFRQEGEGPAGEFQNGSRKGGLRFLSLPRDARFPGLFRPGFLQ